MARRDGSGPMGDGPMTGRGMGYCAGEAVGRPYGRGVGYGRGARFCRGAGFGGYPVEGPINTMSDKEWLSEEKAALEDKLNLVNKELDNLGDE